MVFLRTFRLAVFFCVFIGAYSASLDVSAQSSRDVDNRLLRLENELETLSRAIYRGEMPPPTLRAAPAGDGVSGANAEIRIQELEGQIRQLTGRLEEQNFRMSQLEQQLERNVNDLSLRLQDLGGDSAVNAGAPSLTRTRPSPPPQTPPGAGMQYRSPAQVQGDEPAPDNTAPEERPRVERLGSLPAQGRTAGSSDPATLDYENAFALLKAGSYVQAEQEFQGFLSNHPDHALASNAQYWLGETYYVRGDYQQAARRFAEGFQKYPEASKAPDSLLKLGMSLAGMGNASDACVALQKLKTDFATVNSPVVRRADVEIARLGCQ